MSSSYKKRNLRQVILYVLLRGTTNMQLPFLRTLSSSGINNFKKKIKLYM